MAVGVGLGAPADKTNKKSFASAYLTTHVAFFTGYPSFGLNLGPSSLARSALEASEEGSPPGLSLLAEFANVSRWDRFVATRLGMVVFCRGVWL